MCALTSFYFYRQGTCCSCAYTSLWTIGLAQAAPMLRMLFACYIFMRSSFWN